MGENLTINHPSWVMAPRDWTRGGNIGIAPNKPSLIGAVPPLTRMQQN